ncbi:MAG: helix-turn-helix domain-containing protein [Thiotrichales bacterium]|jgi:transposase-like protein|nr:helix-turn-helix domain-containing protein [Thiotrichales bacterium]
MAKNQTLLAVQDVLAGMPVSEAAAKHGVNRTTISRHLKRNNIVKPPKMKKIQSSLSEVDKVQSDDAGAQKHVKRSYNIDIALLSELILEQKTLDEMAQRMQIPIEVLSEYIKDHGIQAHRAKRILSDLSYRSKGYWFMGNWIAEKPAKRV